jgi:hypothetical protein
MTPANHRQSDGWMAFGLGVMGGVIGGLSLLSFAGIFVVAIIAIVGGFAVRPRPFGAAGVFLGWGVTWLSLLAAAQAHCDPASCNPPDLMPWVGTAVGLAAIGVLLLAIAIRHLRAR